MNIPKYARYDYCNRKACEFLEEYNINSFPVDIERIIHNNRWGLIKYSEIMQELSCDLKTVIKCLKSEDGYTQLDEDNYSIAYNDSEQLGERKRFTLMHEVGHIYLEHLEEFEATHLYRGSLTKQENKVLENEANAFARNVLVPSTMLQHLKNQNASNIAKQFGVTIKAAKTRLDFYQRDYDLNEINSITPRLLKVFVNFYYKKKCNNCDASLIQKQKYCPICGKESLQWGDGKMKYASIESHTNGKLKICPICKNEETEIEGNFCQICNLYLVNECQNLNCKNYEQILPTNARYCPVCGNESLFLHCTILKCWNHYADDFSNIPNEVNDEVIFKIPDGVEEEGLPFN